jgi:hypothetical protein
MKSVLINAHANKTGAQASRLAHVYGGQFLQAGGYGQIPTIWSVGQPDPIPPEPREG